VSTTVAVANGAPASRRRAAFHPTTLGALHLPRPSCFWPLRSGVVLRLLHGPPHLTAWQKARQAERTLARRNSQALCAFSGLRFLRSRWLLGGFLHGGIGCGCILEKAGRGHGRRQRRSWLITQSLCVLRVYSGPTSTWSCQRAAAASRILDVSVRSRLSSAGYGGTKNNCSVRSG
jgi:hypothetical protein